jgi:HAD superfamily hydrolase (TIGR01509 family)
LIFDFDGLVVDTESAIYVAWDELYRSQGHELTLAEYVNCVGSTFGQFDPVAELDRRLGRPADWSSLLEVKNARIRELHAPLGPLPGVRELLEAATSRDVPCAVASSSERRWVLRWIERLELKSFFRVIRTADHVANVKPAPDLFLSAAEALDLPPSDCLVLEDSRNGLLAARAAGMPCVIVPGPVTRDLDFTGAERVLDSLADMTLDDLLQVAR